VAKICDGEVVVARLGAEAAPLSMSVSLAALKASSASSPLPVHPGGRRPVALRQ